MQLHVGQPAGGNKGPLILIGRTYDLSASGLSVYLPAVDCNIQELFDEKLDVVFSITPMRVKVKATPVRCETIVPGLPDKSACIGMKIDQQDGGYPKYLEYLREFQ